MYDVSSSSCGVSERWLIVLYIFTHVHNADCQESEPSYDVLGMSLSIVMHCICDTDLYSVLGGLL